MAYSRLSVVPNIGGSSLLIVTTTPASTNVLQRVLVEGGHRPGGDVGGRADLERDPVLGEVLQQRGVLGGGRAVADPLGAEVAEGVPHRLGPGRLAGVRQAAQPGGPGGVEVGLELRPGYADLGTAEPEPDQRVRRVVSA